MATVIPPRLTDVHAAHEGEATVDHHELLVMRTARGGMIGEAEAKVRARHQVKDHALKPLALTREDEVEVPREQVDTKLGASPAQAVEELQKAYIGAGRHVGAAQERDTAVELPARHQHVALRAADGAVHGVVVVRGVDEQAAVVGVKPTPYVPSDADDRRHRSSGETPFAFTAVSSTRPTLPSASHIKACFHPTPAALVAERSIADRVEGPAPAVFAVPRELEIVALGATLSI
jgi:hypothetical protein